MALRQDYVGRLPNRGDEIYDLERALFRIVDDSHRIDPAVPRDQQGLGDLDVSVEEYLTRLGVGKRTFDFLALWGTLGSGATPPEWSALSALSLIAASGFSAYAWYGAVTEKFERGTPGLSRPCSRRLSRRSASARR